MYVVQQILVTTAATWVQVIFGEKNRYAVLKKTTLNSKRSELMLH